MNDETLIENSRQIAIAILTLCERKGVRPEDQAHLAAMSLSEILAQHLGPFGAIERLRDIADTLERGLFTDLNVN